jgi:acetylornithine/N-succinyldiaminopimelate aminotransferase
MMTDWPELERQYLMYPVKRAPLTLVRGEGVNVWDDRGRQYLDFMAGWAVNALGHCPPVVAEAVCNQVQTLIHVSNQFYSVPQVQLGELLVKNSVFDKAFFGNSGAEANDGAVKLARKYGKLKLNGAYGVITTMHSFHGRTLAMVAATGKPAYQQPYTPLCPGFMNIEYNDLDAIKRATTKDTCAIMLELVQGEGGVNVASKEYIKGVRDWCDEKGLLFIADEVQTGIGRTGTLFAYEQYGIEPDIMTLAKALASGIPIGAVLAKDSVAVWEPGDHGSTFGGNPLACAAGFATMTEMLNSDVSGNAKRVGAYLRQRLEEIQRARANITEVRGLGLLLAIEFTQEIAPQVVSEALERGLLINWVTPTTVRFMPPLIITNADVDKAIAILADSITAATPDQQKEK